MELYELTQKVKELFEIDGLEKLGPALMNCALNNDVEKMDRFVDLVGGDLSVDWLQKIYQYNLADRKEKKQDFTPACLAELLSALIGEADAVVDMCAGSGALTIQRWVQNPDQEFELYEIDASVVPFLLFNLSVRNIRAAVNVGDVLSDEFQEFYQVVKGEKYGRVARVQPSV